MNEPKPRRFEWKTLLRLLFVLLIFGGQPLLRLLRQHANGVTLPFSVDLLLPMLVGALVFGSIIVSLVRAIRVSSAKRNAAPELPRTPAMPMPPAQPPMQPPVQPPSAHPYNPQVDTGMSPTAPRFEPIFTPRIMLLGGLGVVALVVAGLAVVALL